MALAWLGAGSRTRPAVGSVAFQSSIRSRWAEQSVVRGSGAQSRGRPSQVGRPDIGTISPGRAQGWGRAGGAAKCAVAVMRTAAWRVLDGTHGAAPGAEHAFSAALAGIDA